MAKVQIFVGFYSHTLLQITSKIFWCFFVNFKYFILYKEVKLDMNLETLIEMSIAWGDAAKIKQIKEKLEAVQMVYYTDQSNKILRKMRVDVDEEDEEN